MKEAVQREQPLLLIVFVFNYQIIKLSNYHIIKLTNNHSFQIHLHY